MKEEKTPYQSLYFIDDEVTEGLQKKYPLYAENFPIWAEQANGMLQ